MRMLDSPRVWPSNKTHLQSVDGYDSDLDGEDSGMEIPADAYPLPAWCVGLLLSSRTANPLCCLQHPRGPFACLQCSGARSRSKIRGCKDVSRRLG